MSHSLYVRVAGVSGKSAEVCIASQTTVFELKKRLAALMGVPSVLQKLIIGTACLDDEEHLGVYCPLDVDTLSIMLIVTVSENLIADIQNPCLAKRLAAIASLVTGGFSCNLAIDTVFSILEDHSPVVQCEAVRVFAEMVMDIDKSFIAAVAADTVQHRMLGFLANLAKEKPRDQKSIGSWAQHMAQDGSGPVSEAVHSPEQAQYNALLVLALLAESDVENAFDAMIARLEHDDEWVRCAAVLSMSEAASAIDEVADHLDHEDPRVRCLALKVLARVARKSDKHAIELVQAHLGDEDRDVRSEAELALEVLAYYPEIWKD
mmetsp:Transcript_105616/g.192123  ORF Transcript_105616/g.192123 Transcript_105616/m.192123 type:complete len:320 (-) Transcript_105616:84-1043(-)